MSKIRYNITREEALSLAWSGKDPLPALGDYVEVIMNKTGKGKVVGYFAATGEADDGSATQWAGVDVHLTDDIATWFTAQNGAKTHVFVFGAEIRPVVQQEPMLAAKMTHKRCASKKDALSFLKKNALMSVSWPSTRGGELEACYWNGKIHITPSQADLDAMGATADDKCKCGMHSKIDGDV